MKKNRLALLLLLAGTLLTVTTCGKNPLYPFEDDPRYARYAYYGEWRWDDYPNTTDFSLITITKDEFKVVVYQNLPSGSSASLFEEVVCLINSWEPIDNPDPSINGAYPSGMRIRVTVLSSTNTDTLPGTQMYMYAYLHTNGGSLIVYDGNWRSSGELFKQ